MKHVVCFSCGAKTEFSVNLGFREDCDRCGADLHVCKNCTLYDESSYNECREPTADRIVEKDRSNLCEHFQSQVQGRVGQDSKKDLLEAAEALFKKS